MNKPVCIIDTGHAAYSKVCYRINHKDPDIVMPTPESNLKITPKEISLIENMELLIDEGKCPSRVIQNEQVLPK